MTEGPRVNFVKFESYTRILCLSYLHAPLGGGGLSLECVLRIPMRVVKGGD